MNDINAQALCQWHKLRVYPLIERYVGKISKKVSDSCRIFPAGKKLLPNSRELLSSTWGYIETYYEFRENS